MKHGRTPAARLAAAGAAVAAGSLVWVLLHGGPATDERASGVPDAARADATDELAPLDAGARSTAGAPHAETTPETPLGDDEFAALLRRIAVAYASGDRSDLEPALELVLGARVGARRVLDWLRAPAALDDAQACSGALVALEAAFELGDRARGGGDELVRAVLSGLPELAPALRVRIVAVLTAARGPGGAVFGIRFLRDVLALRHAHPELAAELEPLVERAGEGLAGDASREDLRRLFLEDSDDPALVKLALGSLLAADPGTFLPLAEDLYARSRERPELRAAIAQVLAANAPVADAAALLARYAADNPYGPLQILGTRPGAADAIAREYDGLLASGTNARGRALLVSGMRGETEPVLLGIARLDPDPGVRLQALLTLSIRGPVGDNVVGELTALRASGETSGGLATHATVLVAENVLLRSSGTARDAARDFLSGVVRDTNASSTDRLDAYARVRAWVPPGTFRGVVVDGRVLE